MYGEMAGLAPGYEGLKRTYIRCSQDRTLMPSTRDAIVAEMNETWPSSPTPLVDFETSHEAMLSNLEALADLLIEAAA